MKPGALVIKKSRWGLESAILGIVLDRTEHPNDSWNVLWCTKDSYKLQIHLASALLELDGSNDEQLLERLCTSM